MPVKDMAAYMKSRWESRRKEGLERLGGMCVVCGSKEDLHFDHIDPATKSFGLSKRPTVSAKRFYAELEKCQLLCSLHHKQKSLVDGSLLNKRTDFTCECGQHIASTKQKAAHIRWCKTADS